MAKEQSDNNLVAISSAAIVLALVAMLNCHDALAVSDGQMASGIVNSNWLRYPWTLVVGMVEQSAANGWRWQVTIVGCKSQEWDSGLANQQIKKQQMFANTKIQWCTQYTSKTIRCPTRPARRQPGDRQSADDDPCHPGLLRWMLQNQDLSLWSPFSREDGYRFIPLVLINVPLSATQLSYEPASQTIDQGWIVNPTLSTLNNCVPTCAMPRSLRAGMASPFRSWRQPLTVDEYLHESMFFCPKDLPGKDAANISPCQSGAGIEPWLWFVFFGCSMMAWLP